MDDEVINSTSSKEDRFGQRERVNTGLVPTSRWLTENDEVDVGLD